MSEQWKKFWDDYAGRTARNEDDLYLQVGKIANRLPVSKEVLEGIVSDIKERLELDPNDNLLELCCGNGLITLPLSEYIKKIYAFDFTESLIETALQFKADEKIEYAVGNAKEDFTKIFTENLPVIHKFLICDATAYFSTEDLEKMIERMIALSDNFRLYLTNIPNDDNKWKFYNTPERISRYEKAVQSGDIFLDGIGRWWQKSELIHIAEKFNLNIQIFDQTNEYSYRMSILLYS